MPSSGADILRPRLMLDTSAYSHLRRAEDAALEAVARADVVLLPTTVLGELEAGFRLGARYRDNVRALAYLLDEPYVEVVDVTAYVARRYGEIFSRLKEAGTPLPINDVWIAASAIANDAHLLTYDSDFARVDGLSYTIPS